MPRIEFPDSESERNSDTTSDAEDSKAPRPTYGGNQVVPEYEKQRLRRIEENKARMEALGLSEMASKIMGTTGKKQSKDDGKGKTKVVEEDDEYKPTEEVESFSSESSADDDEFLGERASGQRSRKVKNKNLKPKKMVSIQKVLNSSDIIDDDEALRQAIALSLEDSARILDMPQSGQSGGNEGTKRNTNIEGDDGRRKRRKFVNNRVLMTEDELILHFFQLDEAGKGGINFRDLRRVANAHDFTWTEKEMVDMIYCFDSDGDGKLSLDDFRGIAARCNMIKKG